MPQRRNLRAFLLVVDISVARCVVQADTNSVLNLGLVQVVSEIGLGRGISTRVTAVESQQTSIVSACVHTYMS